MLATETAEIRNAGIEENATKSTERRRVLRDIDIAIAMREHLAVTNPELTMATSLIGAVWDRSYTPKNEAVMGTVVASGKESGVVDIHPSVAESSKVRETPEDRVRRRRKGNRR